MIGILGDSLLGRYTAIKLASSGAEVRNYPL